MQGTLQVAWFIERVLVDRSGRNDCASIASSYDVQIADGAGTVLAVATLGPPLTLQDSIDSVAQTLCCQYSYSATVPSSPVYIHSVSDSEGLIEIETVNAGASPPMLTALFSCGPNVPCIAKS